MKPVLAGIFVGGASRRMGGTPKGLLRLPSGETLVERWRAVFDAMGIGCVLVGARAEYSWLDLELVADVPPGIGPLGGLIGLLLRVREGRALAVACDMPNVPPALVGRLARASSTAAVIAPRDGTRWQPLFARYDAPRVLPIARRRAGAGSHSLQAVLDEAAAEPFPLTPEEVTTLRDWDTPEDIAR